MVAGPDPASQVKPRLSEPEPTAEEAQRKYQQGRHEGVRPGPEHRGTCAGRSALFTSISPLVGMGVGVFVAVIILMIYSRDNKPKIFLQDCRRMMDIVGPLSMLPTLLAALGSVFTGSRRR